MLAQATAMIIMTPFHLATPHRPNTMSRTLLLVTLLANLLLGSCSADYGLKEGLPEIEFSTQTIDFGEVNAGIQLDVSISVENVGRGDLVFESVEIDGTTSADFSVLPLESELIAPGSGITLSARYAPETIGQDYGNIVLTSNADNLPTAQVALIGFGVEPEIDVDPETLWYGELNAGSSASLNVSVGSVGTGTIRITDIALEDPTAPFRFVLPPDVVLPYAMTPGHSFLMAVFYEPVDASPWDTNLVISSSSIEDPKTPIRLLGNSKKVTDNQPPIVEITDPNFASYIVEGDPTLLAGSVIDAIDPPENLTVAWTVNGARIGYSKPDPSGLVSLTTADLPVGDATIALTAYDSEGEMGQDSATVRVWDAEEPMRYTISGGSTVYDYWTVDDDVYITLNDTTIFNDNNHRQDTHPPLEFEARRGDELRIVAIDVNYCQKRINSLVLHFGGGSSQPLSDAVCVSACEGDTCYDADYTGPWPNAFMDESHTIAIP